MGEQVVIRNSILNNDGKRRKTLPKYRGPFVVTAVLPHDRYIVEDLPEATRSQKKYKGVCAVDRMKLYAAVPLVDGISSDDAG